MNRTTLNRTKIETVEKLDYEAAVELLEDAIKEANQKQSCWQHTESGSLFLSICRDIQTYIWQVGPIKKPVMQFWTAANPMIVRRFPSTWVGHFRPEKKKSNG